MAFSASMTSALAFIGEVFMAVWHAIRGRARFRRTDLGALLYECGPQALPIVSLISVLVGIILAFVGVVQLRMFGAQIYIADLVGISMVREMGALMTAIIMTGRTGASYATQLGTMEVNEEIDALKTLGFEPVEFLVLPRILALVLMMPLLCVYADIVGILGGALVGVGMFDLSPFQYWEQTLDALNLTQFTLGVVKGTVFALLIASAGCFHGMRSDRSASAVGYAATRAVVVGIVMIVVTDGLFAVVTSILRI
jgi:phospholipid/cholesterol/gamma-HCH transport system permease protein